MSPAPLPRPWFREPLVWLVIALPASAVIAGFATLWIAIDAGGADSVRAPVSRTAQLQTADLAPDHRARELGLQARLQREPDTGALRIGLEPTDAGGARLVLRLSHPTRAALDQDLVLSRSGNDWLGRLPTGSDHDWLLELAPEDSSWRLIGRLPAGADAAELHPDFGGP